MNRTQAAAGVAAFLLTVTVACNGHTRPGSLPKPLPKCTPNGVVSTGEPIPLDCRFERLDGGVLRLRDLVGKPTVVYFWASWCTACVEGMPALERLSERFGDRLQVLGVDVLGVQGETRSAAKAFADRLGARFPSIFDDGGNLYANFSARLVMPVTIFVRADGIVAHRRFGPHDEPELRDLVRTYLRVS